MQGFAIHKLKDDDDDLHVPNVHLNVWVLDGLPARHRLFFEVGIHFRKGAAASKLTGFELVLPFALANKENISDIGDKLLDEPNLRLVFGKASVSNGVITWATGADPTGNAIQSSAKLARVDVKSKNTERLDETPQKAKLSVWRFLFHEDDTHAETLYARLRFEVREAADLWKWNCGIFGKNGALFDLKCQDPRALGDLISERRAFAIEELNCHLTVPEWLEIGTISPSPKYVRLFEGHVWEKFLDFRVDLWRSQKLVVYAWEAPSVSLAQPFRVFASFLSHPGTPHPVFYLVSVALVALLSGVAVWCWLRYLGNSSSTLAADWAVIKTCIIYLFGAGVIVILKSLVSHVKMFRAMMTWAGNAVYKVERYCLQRPRD